MIPVTTFADQNVALFGLGGSGMIAARALMRGGARVSAYDDNVDSVEKAKSGGINTCDLRQCDFDKFDQLVLAPGVPLTHPNPHWSVELAEAANVPVIGDIELFCAQRREIAPQSTLIAITGTNGKSSTTALISHVLQSAGRKVEMGGNIGRAVLDFDELSNDTIYVVEVSSYQVDLAPGIDADIGILLNVSPDHLDRHGSMENYAAIKERLVQKSASAILGVDDEWCRAIAKRLDEASIPLTRVSVREQLEQGVYTGEGAIYYAQNGPGEKVADLTGIGPLRGFHNAQNACVAWRACRSAGLSNEEIQAGFENYPGLEDRMEELGNVGNILIVNDSKGTNADATNMALGSYERIYWIAGGLAKEGGIESLRPHFSKVAKAYLIGEAAPVFAGTLGADVEFEISGTLEKALCHAVADAKKDNGSERVILMSPACASFDQFPSYAVRGERFRQLVQQIDGFSSRTKT
ncbi:MAG: UDP-N-acetylmuramoyl-L-alanine--D-glutamate ligase [Rhizobiaceae bacterium]|nr:UDP-N-acetylmuramoyl-L-alanine--D-glutamate ligase [Rhizobiaceae bacterium]